MEWGAKGRRTGENDGTARGACSTRTSTEGREVATSSGYEYEVFLSFRGEDTRTGFTDFLYTSMIDAGIRVYKDDEEPCKGENFGLELLRAINQSKISIPIFSKGYASSVWCLKELVQMVKCQKTRGQKIMPIFYDVAPSEVQHQIRGYGEAFLSHEKKKRYDKETMLEWKAALTTVGELDGWDLHKMANRKEGEMAKTVTQKIFNELKKAYLVVSNNLVGVDSHVDKIMKEIGAHINETRIVGIHGMGGIGKTTIAKIIYNELSNKYDNCCFLSNIHETSKLKGIEYLQQQLIHDILKTKWVEITSIDEGIKTIKKRLPNKKVLLLLDDVEEKDHMDALVGKRDWFGEGSKLIVTTRRKDVLFVPEVDWRYELTCLDPNLSLQLFSKHAFRKDYPLDEYIGQSKRAIGIAGGLPLALEVIGSLLSHTTKEMWDIKLKNLENVPPAAVKSKLKINYDALDVRQQVGYNKDNVVYFGDESKYLEEAMEVTQNLSLIKIEEDNEVWMHDQLRDLRREMVHKKTKTNMWENLQNLELHDLGQVEIVPDLSNLNKLRSLQIRECGNLVEIQGELPQSLEEFKIEFCESLQKLPDLSSLKGLQQFEIVYCSKLNVEATLGLTQRSNTNLWENLQILRLSELGQVKILPDLSNLNKLRSLQVQECGNLVEIQGKLPQSLEELEIDYCVSLQKLPDLSSLNGLQKVDINCCMKLNLEEILSFA